MFRESGKLVPVSIIPTTDKVDTPKAAPAKVIPSTPITFIPVVSTSTAVAPSSARNPLVSQLVSFFFDAIQGFFKAPTTVDSSYGGFEVTLATDLTTWTNAFHDGLYAVRAAFSS